jgi:Na+-transporting methylmalonyl-CoA/oxaloacetate decarboxylase gamma subunit
VVVVMGRFWLDVLGIIVVFAVVFLLVLGAEREQTDRRTQQNDHR